MTPSQHFLTPIIKRISSLTTRRMRRLLPFRSRCHSNRRHLRVKREPALASARQCRQYDVIRVMQTPRRSATAVAPPRGVPRLRLGTSWSRRGVWRVLCLLFLCSAICCWHRRSGSGSSPPSPTDFQSDPTRRNNKCGAGGGKSASAAHLFLLTMLIPPNELLTWI